jgi:hypothetical protein
MTLFGTSLGVPQSQTTHFIIASLKLWLFWSVFGKFGKIVTQCIQRSLTFSKEPGNGPGELNDGHLVAIEVWRMVYGSIIVRYERYGQDLARFAPSQRNHFSWEGENSEAET